MTHPAFSRIFRSILAPSARLSGARPVATERAARHPSGYMASTVEMARAERLLSTHRVAVFIVAYNAQSFIRQVLARIPPPLRDQFAQIYIIDDSSQDNTFNVAIASGRDLGITNLVVLRTPFNRGYGGNQKLGYLHAIEEQFDFVILLHGDGQYAPECLPRLLSALADDDADVVIGSRMLRKRDALRGGMPLYKWIGNQVLTRFANAALGTRLSEFHSGYRVYRVAALRSINFQANSDNFHFDTEILIQLSATGARFREVPIPTFYGSEICYVDGVKYARDCAKAVAKFHLIRAGLFYEPNFDFSLFEEKPYYLKEANNSLHQFVLRGPWCAQWTVADLGANDGELSAALTKRVGHVTSVDLHEPTHAAPAEALALNLNSDFVETLGRHRYDCVVALDIIEHLARPEEALQRIFAITKPGGRLVISTANVAFCPVRVSLLLGQFNYGKRGVLDLTHTRLFTIYSFRKLLTHAGFRVRELHGFGPPLRDMVGTAPPLAFLDFALGRLAHTWPSLFAFNFLFVAERMDALQEIYQRTEASGSSSPS